MSQNKSMFTFLRNITVLSAATVFWIFLSWGSYHLIRDGMDAQMMGYEAISPERHEEIWRQLVKDTMRKNLGFTCVMLGIGIVLGFAWVSSLRDHSRK